MCKQMRMIANQCKREVPYSLEFLSGDVAKKVSDFHKSFPMYRPTPLAHLAQLAKVVGVADLYVKDESHRFGLNAFKVLGGSYAIGSYLAERLGKDVGELSYEEMISPEVKGQIGDVTFITATDGNHGRGVAWTANQLGQKSVVYMPKGSAPERLENIKKEGADAQITHLPYDDTVRLASQHAQQYGWVLVQDTAWEGYEGIPCNIMQGYTTMAQEVAQELPQPPTHIFLQAGVGSLPAAIAGYFSDLYQENKPTITIVEPHSADCIFRTAEANDEKLHAVPGEMKTLMAGLACGEPSPIAWEILRDYADFFLTCDDAMAANGMRILGAPLKDDSRVISGESGAATLGCLVELMTNDAYSHYRNMLNLNETSRVLLFSTEGNTDKENYLDIVWKGK